MWTDIADPHSPMGAHGVGEIGITGVGAAVANAVYNATGKRIRELPIRLDAKNLYPTIQNLPGAPFDPKPLKYTQATIGQPLPPGDYEVPILAFCTEYSIHRPGAGVAYSLGPLLGKAKEAVANLLWRGTWQGVGPSELQGAAWSIQSGLTFNRLPKTYQQLITRLVPDFQSQISDDFYQKAQDTYNGAANVSGMPSFDSILGGLGPAGELAVSAQAQRQALLADATDDKVRQQTLFAGAAQGIYTPENAEVGPWTVRYPGAGWLRYKIVSGNLNDDNIMQIRIAPGDGSSHISLLDLFQASLTGAQGITVTGMIGYPRGQGAQDLIPVLLKPYRGP